MARRNTKIKKAVESDVKVPENEAPRKPPKRQRQRSGKTKEEAIVQPVEDLEQEESEALNGDSHEKAPVDKKKRGKKAIENGEENREAAVAPAKRGRKKNAEPSIDTAVKEQLIETPTAEEFPTSESTVSEEKPTNGDILGDAENSDNGEMQTDVEEIKSKKKPAKKETKAKESKIKKEKDNSEDADKAEEKPKGKGRGRKAQPKPTAEQEKETEPEKIKTESAKPKKGRGKAVKDKIPDNQDVVEEGKEENKVEEKPEKAKKGRGATKDKTENIKNNEKSEENIEEKSQNGKEKTGKEMTPDSTEDNSVENQMEDEPEPEKAKKKPAKGRGKGKKAPVKEEVDDDATKEPDVEEPASKKRKVNKKENGQGDANENLEEDVTETKVVKGKRGQKKPVEDPEEEMEPEDTGEAKRRRKPVEDKAPAKEAKQKAPLKNKASTSYDDIDFSNTSVNAQGKEWNFKIACWNVDGIRAWMTKGGLDYLQHEKPDILCLQEVKCSMDKLPDECKNIPGYHAYWLCSDKDGYAGVGIYTTKLAMNVQYGLQNQELDSEGRIITAEYEHFYLISTYVPNAGRKLVTLPKRLEWNEAFRNHVKELDKKKPVIICGDMNVAHNEIDLANPKINRKNAGFTEEERSGMTDLLGDGFVDTYRHLYPDSTGAYTFWTYMGGARAKNVGWRLDYFLVSQRLMPAVCDNVIRSQVYGSDHCPIALFLHLTTADRPKEE